MKLKLLKGFGIKVLYIVDINNYIVLPDAFVLSKININKDVEENELIKFVSNFFPNRLDEIKNGIKNIKQPESEENKYEDKYTISIHPSRKCNLHCKYCFGSDGYLPCGEIDIETAKKAIDFLVFNYGAGGSMYIVDLSGSGEPLLRFDFIKELDEYCDSLRNKTGKQILINFATNATLLTDETTDYLKNCKCIIYGVSIDGNERQNSNRLYKTGKPIYNDLIKGIDKINNDLLGLAVTVTHTNEDVDEIYNSLYSLKPSAISIHFVRDYDKDSPTSLYNIDMDNLLLHYNKLIELFIEHFDKGDYEFFYPLLRGDDFFGVLLKKINFIGYIPKYRCGGGRSKIAVDDKGKLYACSIMNGNEDFCIGDIYKGIDKERQAKFFNSNIQMSQKCRECWCRNICAGECMANSYLQTKTLYEPNTFLCELKQNLIPIAITFAEYLRKHYPTAYLAIRKQVISLTTYTNSDSATWSVLKILQHFDYPISFSDIADNLSKLNNSIESSVDIGIHPQFVELYLKNFDKNFNAVVLEDADSIEQIYNYPVIAYLNKCSGGYHHYVLIESANKKEIKYRNLKGTESNTIETNVFLTYLSNIVIGNIEI